MQKNFKIWKRIARETKIGEIENTSISVDQLYGRIVNVDKGRGSSIKGRGRGGKFEGICFKCGMQGHGAFECPKIMKDERR